MKINRLLLIILIVFCLSACDNKTNIDAPPTSAISSDELSDEEYIGTFPEVVYQEFEGMTFGPFGGINASKVDITWETYSTGELNVTAYISEVDFTDLHFLATIPNISSIVFESCDFQSLDGLEQMETLSSITLNWCSIPDDAMLPYLPLLENVTVESNDYTVEDIWSAEVTADTQIHARNIDPVFYEIESLITDDVEYITVQWGVFDDFSLCSWLITEIELDDYEPFSRIPVFKYIHTPSMDGQMPITISDFLGLESSN